MSRRAACIVLALGAIFLFVVGLATAQQAQINPDAYSELKFRYIGPVGNRATAVAGVPSSPYIYYVGAASGGIFKTTDGGGHWDPIFDSQPVSSIGSLAVAQSDPNIVWAGTGESFIRSHISVGEGIFKSIDAGKTWNRMGLEKTGRIGNVIIDPRNPDIVLACALGHAYGSQPDRGVFRTTDGGKNWEKVLFVDENTGCSDMGMDLNNSRILYAGMWQIEIHTWGRTSGGPGSGLFKSTDGGATWKRLEGHGLPHAPVGRIAVRVAQRDSNRVYALIETGDGAPFEGKPTQSGQLWRSDNGGEDWQLVNSDRQIRGRTHYYTREEIAPDNENEVYFFSAAFSRTLDGGHTLTNMPSSPGGDNHEMWIDPTNGDRMAVVNDAGVSISVNRGHTWDHVSLPIAQIYHVTVDDQIPYFVYGNKQDGSSYRGPSNSLQFGGFGGGGISRSVWHPIAGGESGYATPDPVDNNIIWSSGTGSGSVSGAVARFDERNHQWREVEVWPVNVSGATAAEVLYRFNWEFPITISPHDHNKVYVGSQFVHVTTDGGSSWQVISPDLTLNDKSRQASSGGLTPDNIGVEYAGTVFAIAESPKEAGLIWAGTNDGRVQITRDGGKNWTNVTKNIPNMLEWGTVSNIEASRYDAGTAYLTVDGHQVNNRDPFVYKTTDYGKTWTSITNGIPHTMLSYAHCVREDPVRKGLLYLGTENSLYVSFDDGKNWQPLQMGLPHAPVYWIAVQERFHDLDLATYGRGFWILDDLTPLQQMTAEVLNSSVRLFAPRDAYRYRPVSQPAGFGFGGDATAGQNPQYGADINFYLKSKLGERDRLRITIADAAGKTLREIECRAPRAEGARRPGGPGGPGGGGGGGGFGGGGGTPPCEVKPGINRVWWNLRSEQATEVKLRTPPTYSPDVTVGPEGFRAAAGIDRITVLEPPGTYTVTLVLGDEKSSQKLNVLKDPHSTGSVSDIQSQVQLVAALRDEMNALAESVNQVESIRAQLGELEKQMGNDDASKAIRKAASELAEKLVAAEGKVIQLRSTGRGQDDVRYTPMLLQKISYLADQVGSSSDFPPTTQQTAVQQELKQQGGESQQEMQQLIAKDVAAFNAMLREKNISNIIVKAP